MLRRFFFAVSVLPFSTLPLAAQTFATGFVGGITGSSNLRAQTNNPVSLVFENKTVQTLSDGTHITNIVLEKFYRDSLGRTRTESESMSPSAGESPMPHMVIVLDPVAGTHTNWLEGRDLVSPVYSRMKIPTSATMVASTPAETQRPLPLPLPFPPVTQHQRGILPQMKNEDLGQLAVQGFPCEAVRTTAVYPEGAFNNDRQFTVVSEICMSRELGRSLQDKVDDPRTGVRTGTVQSISRGEPDPSLFQPPPNYTERVIHTQ